MLNVEIGSQVIAHHADMTDGYKEELASSLGGRGLNAPVLRSRWRAALDRRYTVAMANMKRRVNRSRAAIPALARAFRFDGSPDGRGSSQRDGIRKAS